MGHVWALKIWLLLSSSSSSFFFFLFFFIGLGFYIISPFPRPIDVLILLDFLYNNRLATKWVSKVQTVNFFLLFLLIVCEGFNFNSYTWKYESIPTKEGIYWIWSIPTQFNLQTVAQSNKGNHSKPLWPLYSQCLSKGKT